MGSDSVSLRATQSATWGNAISGAPVHPTVKKVSDEAAPVCFRMACLCRSMDSSIWRRAFDGSEAGWPSGAAGFCAKRIPVQIAIVADERDRPRITLAEVDIKIGRASWRERG